MEQKAQNAAIELLSATIGTGRTVRIRARGGSMRPLIPDGSVVELGPLPNQLSIGDVVAARVNGRFVIHRVVSLGPMITLRGDTTRANDPLVHPHDIIAIGRTVTTPGGWKMRIDTTRARLAGRIISRLVTHRSYPVVAKVRDYSRHSLDFIDISR